LIVAIRDLSIALEHTRRMESLVAETPRLAPRLERFENEAHHDGAAKAI
jgi:hypothetical protein